MNESPNDDESVRAGAVPAPAVVLRPMPAPQGSPPESRIGERLKDARQQLGLSVEALSRLTKLYDIHEAKGVSPPTLGRYESSDTTPNLRELRLLSESLDVPVQWLVDGSLPDVRGQEAAQRLISAFQAFIHDVTSDQNKLMDQFSDQSRWFREDARAAMLLEAKKPISKAKPHT